jgi:Pyruvate/2-oxoacid:ferredoxin oxidoreductase gamma subunit
LRRRTARVGVGEWPDHAGHLPHGRAGDGQERLPVEHPGLPTWYEIRVSKHGYNARTPHFDLMVALNAATYSKDVAEVRPNGWLLYDSSWPLDERLKRADVTYIGSRSRRCATPRSRACASAS